MKPISISSVDIGPKTTSRSGLNPQRSASSGELSNHMSILRRVPFGSTFGSSYQ